MTHLLDRVLARLGLTTRPKPTLEGLRATYAAWCRRVPFDNLRKLIHIRSGSTRDLPGSTPEDFFTAWLRDHTGGTCWAGAGAFHALLTHLGFDASRGIGTMLVYPDLPPNHGTVLVKFGPARYLVDCSMLHGEPLLLDESTGTSIDHPAWGVRCEWRDGHFHILWRPLHKTDGLECRLERLDATAHEYRDLYELTREWSPFNYEITARTNTDREVHGVSFGKAVTLHHDGSVTDQTIRPEERLRRLVEDLRFSEKIVAQLPPDVHTPPPPHVFKMRQNRSLA